MATRKRNHPIDIFETFDKPVRLYGPTASLPYYWATFYEPGAARQQRTTLGRDGEAARQWAHDKAEALRYVQDTPRPERPYERVDAILQVFLDRTRNELQWRARTEERNRDLVRALMPSWFLLLQGRQVDEEILQRLINEAAPGHKPGYIKTYSSLIRTFARWSLRKGYFLARRVNSDLKLVVPQLDHEQDPDELVDWDALPPAGLIEELIDAIARPECRTMLRVARSSGARFSELAGLHWTSVDLERGRLRIVRKLAETNRGRRWLEATKNRRSRTTVFARADRDALAELVETARAREAAGGLGLVFTAPRGGFLSRNNFGKRVWEPATQKVEGWKRSWSFHTLRHCAAVAMLDDLGLTAVQVSRLLGHRDPGVTERLYLQGRADTQDQAAEALGWGDDDGTDAAAA